MAEEEEDYDGGDASSNSDHEDPFSVCLQFDFHRYLIGFWYLTPSVLLSLPIYIKYIIIIMVVF